MRVTYPTLSLSLPSQAGWAPIHFAACNGHVEAVRALVEGNADLLAKNEVPRLTPYPLAVEGCPRDNIGGGGRNTDVTLVLLSSPLFSLGGLWTALSVPVGRLAGYGDRDSARAFSQPQTQISNLLKSEAVISQARLSIRESLTATSESITECRACDITQTSTNIPSGGCGKQGVGCGILLQ